MTNYDNPAFYHLGLDSDTDPAIEVHLHPGSLKTIERNRESIVSNQRYLGLTDEFTTESEAWGYGGIAKIADSSLMDGWANIRFPIPEYDTASREDLLPISASIDFPLQFLNTAIKKSLQGYSYVVSKTTPQFLRARLDNMPGGGSYSSQLFVTVESPLIKYLRDASLPELGEEISMAMYHIDSRFFKRNRTLSPDDISYEYQVSLRSARDIHLDVPGSSTGLDSAHENFRQPETSDKEYKLLPHNTDTVAQQLALLSGIAFLGQKALEAYL